MCCIGKCYATLYSLSTTIFLRHCLPLISENMHFRMTLQEKTCHERIDYVNKAKKEESHSPEWPVIIKE